MTTTWEWSPGSTTFSLNPIDLPVGADAFLELVTLGTASLSFTGNTAAGSFEIIGLSIPASSFEVGQAIQAAGLAADGSAGGGIPPGSYIDSVGVGGANTFTITNGQPGSGNVAGTPQAAYATSSALSMVANDPYPIGSLALSVSPTSGISMIDNNYDGTGDPGHTGNGQTISNMGGYAIGGVWVTFDGTGTFDLSATFTSADPNYTDATLANFQQVVVA